MKEIIVKGGSRHGCYEFQLPGDPKGLNEYQNAHRAFMAQFEVLGLNVREGLGGCVVQPVEGSDWMLVDAGCRYRAAAVNEDGDSVYTESDVQPAGYCTAINKEIWESKEKGVRIIFEDTIEDFD